VLLVALGAAVAFAPDDVPGLTLPGSPEAMEAMEAIGMEPGAEHDGAMNQGGMSGAAEEGGGMQHEASGAGEGMGRMP
jgi:hypothetical protein